LFGGTSNGPYRGGPATRYNTEYKKAITPNPITEKMIVKKTWPNTNPVASK
jgi:hypothetical protein